MPEGANVEIAHDLTERAHGHKAAKGWHRAMEAVEIAILAIVAVATAWSGYQAAKWDGRQTFLYGEASRQRFAADAASTLGGQDLVTNVSLFTSWLQAHSQNDVQLQRILERRMTPSYKVAFDAWLGTDPFNNVNAPAGPSAMPVYKNPGLTEAKRLNAEASATFDQGTEARETGEKYVLDTVLLAVVLFIIAIAQRLQDRTLRLATNIIGLVMLVYALVSALTLHRL
ncbi:MAG TPA: hypothetical protein VIB48_03865 [Acidimicrobiia bacterium]|jgi:hypothetical protein